jgi:septal ring factor EnvC (AmiA/AmiB activator)
MLDSGLQAAERIGKRQCSERNLSETDCAQLTEVLVGHMREGTKEQIRQFDENCKNSTSFEEQCLEKKREAFQRVIDSNARVK